MNIGTYTRRSGRELTESNTKTFRNCLYFFQVLGIFTADILFPHRTVSNFGLGFGGPWLWRARKGRRDRRDSRVGGLPGVVSM